MDSCMDAGLKYSALETSVVPAYRNLPASWQLLVLAAIFVWLILAQLTALTKHVRSLVQPFVLRHVESEVPVLLAIQVVYLSICHFITMEKMRCDIVMSHTSLVSL